MHDERRHQLDLRVTEISDLRQVIQDQAAELQGTEEERKRLASERAQVARTVAALEADLNNVRREAGKIRRDVAQLRDERAHLHAQSKEDKMLAEKAQTQVRRLRDDIASLQKRVRRHEEAAANHVCAAYVGASARKLHFADNYVTVSRDDETLASMQQLHREHCQSFMRRIHYLKARVTRESAFRSDLVYQKQHLLGTIGCFEKS